MTVQSTKNITQPSAFMAPAQITINSKSGNRHKPNRISEKDIKHDYPRAFEQVSLIQSLVQSSQPSQRSTTQEAAQVNAKKNAFEIKQILKMNAHHQKMNSQRSSAI